MTCNQEGEERPPCTLSSVVYESMCKTCNPSFAKKGDLETQESEQPSLYVGETSRSIQERAQEHWGDARRGDPKSHMVRHQGLVHPGEPPAFHFKMISSHRSALSRQVREAVRIRRRGGATQILNSKCEFNRCHIPRLVVEEEDKDEMVLRQTLEQQERVAITRELDEDDVQWERRKQRDREQDS